MKENDNFNKVKTDNPRKNQLGTQGNCVDVVKKLMNKRS